MNLLKKDIIFSDVNKLKGVGKQLSKYLKNRKIEKIKDILLNLPYSETDRSKIVSLNKLEVGKIQTIRVIVKKLNFGIAEVVLAIPEEFIDVYTTLDLDEVADEFRKKNNSLIQIGTKYVNITRRFLEEKGVTNFEIIKSLGATELMPKLLKNCMCISDVSQTGSTLKSNKLRVLENGIIMKTSACLFINKKSYKKKGINNLIKLLSK